MLRLVQQGVGGGGKLDPSEVAVIAPYTAQVSHVKVDRRHPPPFAPLLEFEIYRRREKVICNVHSPLGADKTMTDLGTYRCSKGRGRL